MRRAEADVARAYKETRRVLRFLVAGPAMVRPAAKEGTALLDGGDRGMISVAATVVAPLLRGGVLRERDGQVSLTAEGRALDKRSHAMEEPFRAQHMEIATRIVQTDSGAQTVDINLAESPLAQLARRRGRDGQPFLAEEEIRAGERLRADYTRGQIMPRLGANWSEAVASGRRGSSDNGIADLTDTALAARQRVDHALSAVGPELAGILVDVCCFLKGLERVETERGWPVRSAKVVLKTALAALSRHYEPQASTRRRTILHWGARDYRPPVRHQG